MTEIDTDKLRALDERLRESDPNWTVPKMRNPDGPEAADAILAMAEENKRLREALVRCQHIVRHNNHRQNEKVDDVVHIVDRALRSGERER